MPYVEAFVFPMNKERIADHKAAAEQAAELWIEHGATSYAECLLDEDANLAGFPAAVQLRDGEIPVLAWIVYDSAEGHRHVTEKVMADPRLNMDESMVDRSRLIYGLFNTAVCR